MTDQSASDFPISPTLFGTTYPTEYLTAMFRDIATAEAAAVALESVGFAREGIVLVTGEQLLRNQQAVRDLRGLRDRLMAQFPSQEAQIAEQYVELAKQGYAVSAVHVPESEPEQRDRAADTLKTNGGGYMHYYGKYTVMDL